MYAVRKEIMQLFDLTSYHCDVYKINAASYTGNVLGWKEGNVLYRIYYNDCWRYIFYNNGKHKAISNGSSLIIIASSLAALKTKMDLL